MSYTKVYKSNMKITGNLTVGGTFVFPATASSLTISTTFVNNGTTQLGNATGDTITLYGHTTTGANCNFDLHSSNGTFLTPTGAGTLSGHTTMAANKDLLCTTGTSKLDFVLGTGIFRSPSGTGTLSGNTTVATSKYFDTADADALLCAGIKVPQRVIATAQVQGAGAATALNYTAPFFIADAVYTVVSVKERHEVAGSDGGAVTLMLKKVPSGTAPSAGTDCLSAGISLKATADTNQAGSLHGSPANYIMAAGDSLSIIPTGALTACQGVTVLVELKRT